MLTSPNPASTEPKGAGEVGAVARAERELRGEPLGRRLAPAPEERAFRWLDGLPHLLHGDGRVAETLLRLKAAAFGCAGDRVRTVILIVLPDDSLHQASPRAGVLIRFAPVVAWAVFAFTVDGVSAEFSDLSLSADSPSAAHPFGFDIQGRDYYAA